MGSLLNSIRVYPVKSLGGISLKVSELGVKGIRHDRRWMLVNEQGDFYSQRVYPELALLHTSINKNMLCIKDTTGKLPNLEIPLQSNPAAELKSVNIWGDESLASLVGQKYDAWFSDYLNQSCRLVYMPDSGRRKNELQTQKDMSFADGYPFLLIGTASLDYLNEKLNNRIEMASFRPNLVVETSIPFEEEEWKAFRINGVLFEMVKPCARCIMVNVNPKTASSNDPVLATLATFKKKDNKVYFGMNVQLGTQPVANFSIRVGDMVSVER